MNRINRFVLIFFSFSLSFVVVFVFFMQRREKEPQIITVPFRIEVYRVDRHALPEADIYLDQRFIGRSDERGVFTRDIKLTVGESYSLVIERDREGYMYGPWETRFKMESEKKRRLKKKREENTTGFPTLEGESDILNELERAQLGIATSYEKSHFLAFVEGHMYYTLRVTGKNGSVIRDAAVIINGKEEGKTEKNGLFTVKYSGEDFKKENIQIIKEGEHIWMDEVWVRPDALIDVRLYQLLLVDLAINTEYYDVIRGVKDADVYLNGKYMGMTDEDGLFSFTYKNEDGVDGPLDIVIRNPEGYLPNILNKTFFITQDLPKLSVTSFAYRKNVVFPKIAVMPFTVQESEDYFLKRQAEELRRKIGDFLSSEASFEIAESRTVARLFRQFNIDYWRENTQWKDIPLIKKELDAYIYGTVGQKDSRLSVRLLCVDYYGDTIVEIDQLASQRELQSLSENIVTEIKESFPIEGNIITVQKDVSINIGRMHGVNTENLFYGFTDYYDDSKKAYSKKRVVKLEVIETAQTTAQGSLIDIVEGYLVEPGVKVKRYVKSVVEEEDVDVQITVTSKRKPVSEANVYVDDNWFGQTDSEGQLSVVVKANINIDFLVYKEGYVPGEQSARFSGKTATLEFDLEQGEAQFWVDSDPRGALIFIDGDFKGMTPADDQPIEVPYGFHLLELEITGYKKHRKYLNFSEKKMSLTGKDTVVLFPDFIEQAEDAYERGNVEKALNVLVNIPQDHPDYREAMEFAGFISLKEIKDYSLSIDFYRKSIEGPEGEIREAKNLFSYYNLAQAYFNEAEAYFHEDPIKAQYNYLQAVENFETVKSRRSRFPEKERQNILFYLSVCYQKLYYITLSSEYLTRAYYSWNDYFDFFPKDLMKDTEFEQQYYIAKSYREEAERLKGER